MLSGVFLVVLWFALPPSSMTVGLFSVTPPETALRALLNFDDVESCHEQREPSSEVLVP